VAARDKPSATACNGVGGADGVAVVSHEAASSTLGIVTDQAARFDFDV
jgi:hypothetical protein